MKTDILAMSMFAVLLLCSCGGHNHNHDHAGEEASHNEAEHTEEEGHRHDHAGEIAFTKEQAKAAGLAIETVTPSTFHTVIRTSGQIVAPQGDEQTVVATASGVLTYSRGSIAEGMAVKAGEAIASVSAKHLQDGDPAVNARAAFETAEREYQRAERLVADKIISAKEYEQAKLNYETARNAYHAQASSMTSRGIAIAPGMGGYIKQLLVAQGEYVTVGQPIAVVTRDRRLQLKAFVPESEYGNLRTISSANFVSPSDKNVVHSLASLNGKLVSYGHSLSDNGAFVPAVFEFDNVGNILPGSYVEVFLIGAERPNTITIPLPAITEEQGLHFVYVQEHDEDYVKRQVTLGDSDGSRRVVISGLKAGEKVVVKGAYNVKLASMSTEIPHGHSH